MVHITKDKGDLAVVKTIADLNEKGFVCFTPIACEHLPFDLIAYKDCKTYRIQVKHSTGGDVRSKTSWTDKKGNHQKRYNDNDFDYYAIYLPEIKTVVYPGIKLRGIVIRHTVPNAPNKFHWFEDYINFTDENIVKTYKDFNHKLLRKSSPRLKNRKVERPQKKELEKLLWEMPTEHIADKFGVSGVTIAKWAKAYGLAKPPRGYWAKLYAERSIQTD